MFARLIKATSDSKYQIWGQLAFCQIQPTKKANTANTANTAKTAKTTNTVITENGATTANIANTTNTANTANTAKKTNTANTDCQRRIKWDGLMTVWIVSCYL